MSFFFADSYHRKKTHPNGEFMNVLFLEVSGHNLESSCRNYTRMREVKEKESQGKATEATVNSKEENS
jgi:hypothetical protein